MSNEYVNPVTDNPALQACIDRMNPNDLHQLNDWLEQPHLCARTKAMYRKEGLRFLLWTTLSHRTLRTVSRDDLSTYKTFLSNPEPSSFWQGPPTPIGDPQWRPFTRGLSPASIKLAMTVIGCLVDYLHRQGYRYTGAVHTLPICLDERAPSPALTCSYMALRLLAEYIDLRCPDARRRERARLECVRWILHLCYLAGLRAGEVVSGRMQDLHSTNDGRVTLTVPTRLRTQCIPLSADVVAALRRYQDFQSLPQETAEIDWPLLLPLQPGRRQIGRMHPMTRGNMLHIFISVRKDAARAINTNHFPYGVELETLTPDSLHLVGSEHRVALGESPDVVKASLGQAIGDDFFAQCILDKYSRQPSPLSITGFTPLVGLDRPG